MTKTEILQAWYDQAWTRGDLNAVERFYTADVTGPVVVPSLSLNISELHAFLTVLRSRVRQIAIKVTQAVEQSGWLAAPTTFSGCCVATAGRVETKDQVLIRFAESKVTGSHGQVDDIALFEQLGHLPQDTDTACLAGQGLTWR